MALMWAPESSAWSIFIAPPKPEECGHQAWDRRGFLDVIRQIEISSVAHCAAPKHDPFNVRESGARFVRGGCRGTVCDWPPQNTPTVHSVHVAPEHSALNAGKTLLVLDTASDDAERLYARHGWQRCGQIPNYALLPNGTPCATTIFFKFLCNP